MQESGDGGSKVLSMNNEAGNEIAISMPEGPTPQAEDSPKYQPQTQDNKHHQTVGESSLTARNEIAISKQGAAAPTAATTKAENHQPAKGSRECRDMRLAAIDGNWVAAKDLLVQFPVLGRMELNKAGDIALHLAVQKKHRDFVENFIRHVGKDVVMLRDGHGYIACHYAAMAGAVDIVRIMTEIDPSMLNVRNKYGTTPFALAISYGNADVISYFLGNATQRIHLEDVEWFNLLLLAITSKMFDLAIEILRRKEDLALMKDVNDRTALHVLAQQNISPGDDDKSFDLFLLARELWLNILGRDKVVELMQNPPILHDAAKVGNLDLIYRISRDYPDLLSHVDRDGYSIFHILVKHRHDNTLHLLKKARDVKNFNALSQDKEGNNFLHSAAKSIDPKGLEIVGEQDVQMQMALSWFKAVSEVAPHIYVDMRNKDGYTPEKLFWKEHAELLARSQAYMKSTAESCMLISTIVITLVFAATFAPPGGFHQSGIPTLIKKKWFTIFIIFQVLALSSSTLSIIGFWSIISFNYKERQFFVLSHYLRLSMCALLLSMLFIISAFLSAFFLIFVQEREVLILSFMLPLYLVIVEGIFYQLFKLLRKTYRLQNDSQMWKTSSNYDSLVLRRPSSKDKSWWTRPRDLVVEVVETLCLYFGRS